MAWFKVDDKLWGHPKWIAAPPSARALWVTAGSWAADQLTDGFIPTKLLHVLDTRPTTARQLVELGLWEIVPGGYRFRGWSDYQPSREEVLKSREAARQRQRDARERGKQRALSRVTDSVTHGVTSREVTDVSHDPDPTRPDPTRPVLPTEVRKALPAKRGTRIPDDYQPTPEMFTKARGEFPSVDLKSETDAFRDWWRAKAGRDAAKVDWDLTWVSWMRRTHKDNGQRSNGYQRPNGPQLYGKPGERKSLV